MNKIVLNTGLVFSVLCLLSFVVWIISFVGIAAGTPLFYWSDMGAYIEHITANDQFFQYLAKSFMIVFSLSFMTMAFVYHEFVDNSRKLLSRIAVAFAVMFAVLSGMHYFVQISSVRFALADGQTEGLQHFLQAYPRSFSSSVNMFAWTVLLGTSSLMLYLALKPGSLNKGIKTGLLFNAVSCIMAGIGFLTQTDIITFFFINIGVGGAFIIVTIASVRYFLILKKRVN